MKFLLSVLALMAVVSGVRAQDTDTITISNTHFSACTTDVCVIVDQTQNVWSQVNTQLPAGVTDSTVFGTTLAPGAVSQTGSSNKRSMNIKAAPTTQPDTESAPITASGTTYPVFYAWKIPNPSLDIFISLSGDLNPQVDPVTHATLPHVGSPTFRYWATQNDPALIGTPGTNPITGLPYPATSADWIAEVRTNPMSSTYFKSQTDANSDSVDGYCLPPTFDASDNCLTNCAAPSPAFGACTGNCDNCADAHLEATYDTAGDNNGWPFYNVGSPQTGLTTYYWQFLIIEQVSTTPINNTPFYVTATTTPACGTSGKPACNSPPGGTGDPQFVGLQGQIYQFHGMADEVFSLVSYPEFQMSSLFKFIASGTCDYNNTVCWSHPGTYLGQIAVQFGNEKILLQSGSHSQGMTVIVNDKVIAPSTHVHTYHGANNSTMTLSFTSAHGDLIISTDKLYFRIANSDYFFNLDFGVTDASIIQAGARHLAVTGEVCERESRSVVKTQNGKVSSLIKATYPDVPLHGLLGQTWRNAIYCGRYFEGVVDDYVTGGLFSNEHTFNMFHL